MTSSSKKKKKKRADFQKIKLKAGRRLPKGLNVTNTAFKTRKIQIREQIRNDVAASAFEHGKKVFSLDDLLRNLNHQNSTTRQNALNGLKDLFNTNKQTICKNLNRILSSISKLFEDKSSDVRKSAQNVLESILSSATSKQISPVFPIVAAYLNCGMTHVEPAIQRDSLKFLDVVLRHFPELLMDSNPKILSNFLEQISRKTLNKSNTGRTLLVNPESRLTGQEWRLQVLRRVQKFIQAILSNSTKLKRGTGNDARNINWNSNLVHVHVPHPESILNEHFPCSGFSMYIFNDFMKKIFEKEFFEYFMMSFPYVATSNDASKNQQKGKKNANPLQGVNLKVLVCNLNLSIVYIFVKLSPTSTDKEKNWSSVIKYLIAVLQNPEYKVVAYDTKIMHDVLKTISTNNNFKDIGENLLSIALSCYKNDNISIKKKSFLLDLFSASSLNLDQATVSSPAITEWLMLLSKELLNAKLFSQVIPIAQTMATMQNEAFLSGLQLEKSNIIELLMNIEARDSESEKNCRGIIELLRYVKQFDTNDYKKLTKYIRNETISINNRCYCITILTLRYNKNAKEFCETEAPLFISFLLSLVLDPSESDLELKGSFLPLRLKVFDADTNLWPSRERILKAVCININEIENLNQLNELFVSYVCNLLNSDYNCSLICSWSIIKFLKDLNLLDAGFTSKDGFVEFLISTIYAELVYEKSSKVIDLAFENKLISYRIVSILEKMTKGIELEAQATTICILLSKLLQHWSPSKKYLLIIKDIAQHLKSRFGTAFTDSVGWNSLLYELEIKFESIN
uniref:Uncharacterized protein n=1 Tax=Strigamia maritima TaxID=126957 RepID=T1JAX7_STRMM